MKPLIKFEHPVSEQAKGCGLPLNRLSAFKDIIKHRYQLLLGMGVALLAFFIPFFITFSLCGMSYDSLCAELESGAISTSAFIEGTLGIYLYELLSLALSSLLLAFPLSFYSRILRSLCFYDSFFFWSEGSRGFKENFLGRFLALLSLSLLSLGSAVLVLYVDFGASEVNWVTSILAFLPLVAIILLLLPTCLVYLSLSSIYKTGFLQGMASSFKIYLNSFFPTLGISLAFLLPFLCLLIPNSLVAGGVLAALIVVYYPLLILGIRLYLLYRFDSLINEERYPSLFHKGLFI